MASKAASKTARDDADRTAVRSWRRDSLVWAPSEKFHWPAVVGGYHNNLEAPNATKVRVRFLDERRTVHDINPRYVPC